MDRYNPLEIEAKWQQAWDDEGIYNVDEGGRKFYLLEMLPYPSGRIHMGHVRNYTIGDVAARYKTMNGYSVLHPIGWDAFGMPAENAAIQRGIHPAKWTHDNIEYMKSQLKRLGYTYDWRREFATCDPDYYRWEQLIFVKMFEKGLAYKKTSQVNWCPSCQTVLANEQVEGGECWRCSSKVEMKSMSQWFFRLTKYADELLRDLNKLNGWPERVRTMQREWIGRSEGAEIDFPLDDGSDVIRVFTTRQDTLFGVTFLSVAAEHPIVDALIAGKREAENVRKFRDETARIAHEARLKGDYEKKGEFTGAYALHPLTKERIPMYAANFVLMNYGTGAVMAVPAHDERDFEFAKKFNLPIKVVVQPASGDKINSETMRGAFVDYGVLVDSEEFSNLTSEDALSKISKKLSKVKMGGPTVNFKLKDWCISRQRYWGAPIPIVYCDKCGTVAVPEKELPVLLPDDAPLTGEGGSPLARLESFVNAKCPKCKGAARRETDTMDTFVESSWYMFRYACPDYRKGPLDKKKIKHWLPVDHYIGGIEHAVGHLIYCRFFTKVMRDLGIVNLDEPVKDLMTQGMVIKDGIKMSKSKGNVVDPDDMIAKFGADTVRLFILFASPPEKDLDWSEKGVEGSHRFLNRVWKLAAGWNENRGAVEENDDVRRLRNRTIKRVTEDIERWHFNTAIAAIMEYTNELHQLKELPAAAIETLIILLSPFVPHIAQELWQKLGNEGFVTLTEWPAWDEASLKEETIEIAVQVNGKVRDKISIPTNASDDDVKKLALESEKVRSHVGDKKIKKAHYVKGRLISIVV